MNRVYKYKVGDIVNVKFKPEVLNPYVITVINKGVRSNSYLVGIPGYKNHYSFEVGEDEIELHISEIRNIKLNGLGI